MQNENSATSAPAIYATRRAQLKICIDQRALGNIAAFAEAFGYDRAQISQYLSESYNHGRSMGERAARALEEKTSLPSGWLDRSDATAAESNVLPPLPAGAYSHFEFGRTGGPMWRSFSADQMTDHARTAWNMGLNYGLQHAPAVNDIGLPELRDLLKASSISGEPINLSSAAAGALHRALTTGESTGQDLLPPMGIRTDRDMLNYLMGAFDTEVWNCNRCGHAEETKVADSAYFLREYLAAAPQPAPVEAASQQYEAGRQQGRAEAVAILIELDPETGIDTYTGWSAPVGPEDEGSAYWDVPKLRELFAADGQLADMMDKAEGQYWHYIGLQGEAERAHNFAANMHSSGKVRDILAKAGEFDLMGQLCSLAAPATQQPAGWLRRTDLVKLGNCRAELWAKLDDADAVPVYLGAPPAPVDVCAEMRALCSNCGGTGDVHRIDGEWLGACTCGAVPAAGSAT